MTNEEKATYIANANQCIDRSGYSSFIECKDSALEMAQWKDQQFKEYLEKKNTEISNIKAKLDRGDADYMLYTLKSLFIDEIINELLRRNNYDK